MKDTTPTLFLPIQMKPRRLASSYVNRDIIFPSGKLPLTPTPLNQTPESSSQVLSPIKRKLIKSNAPLKSKISEKNRVLRNVRAKTNRMCKRLLSLKEVVKELSNRPGLEIIEMTFKFKFKLVDRVNGISTGKISHSAEYDNDFKKLALPIHFYSPRSNTYIRDKFDLCLPHVNTLWKWYSRLDCEPGFTRESRNTISQITKKGPLFVNLTFDEIKIREELEIVDKEQYGNVNVGNDLYGD